MLVSLTGGKGENILTSLEVGGGGEGAMREARSRGGKGRLREARCGLCGRARRWVKGVAPKARGRWNSGSGG